MRPPTRHFRNFVSKLAVSPETNLPLTHVTDAYDLRSIIEEKTIKTRHCDIFKHELLYLFYGRPSYRKNSEVGPNGLTSYYPVVFILDPALAKQAIQMYPFDTGAFEYNRFCEHVHRRMQVRDFSLEVGIETPGKLVSYFFKSNKRYYDRRAEQVNVPKSEFETESYASLIGDRGQNFKDERASSIEIALGDAIALGKGVLAVAIPESLIDDPNIGDSIKILKIDVIPYDDGPGFQPNEHTAYLYHIIRDYYKKKGII